MEGGKKQYKIVIKALDHVFTFLVLVLFLFGFLAALGTEEFPPTSPLQLLLLLPNLPHALHFLGTPTLLSLVWRVGSSCSFTLLFLGLLDGLRLMGGCTKGSPVDCHMFYPLIGSIIGP